AAIAYNWQFVTPFGIQSASDFMVGPPPALTSEAFTRAFNEVKTVGAIASTSTERRPDRANVALYFAATSPTQAMNQAAREVAEEQGGSLSENARALALMNMAINDSLVASFLNKYHYNFWRPETAIHTATIAGNPKLVADPGWASFIVTPCFPSYPSNHGSAVNAAGEVLRRLYGEAGHVITLTNTTTPTIILHYNSFTEIDDDVSDARVYGGIHFRTDQEAGSEIGGAIGAAVYRSNLRPRWPLSILPTAERRQFRTAQSRFSWSDDMQISRRWTATIALLTAASIASATSALAQTTEVTGAGNPSVDVPAIQAAVNLGGEVVLRGHFSFDTPPTMPTALQVAGFPEATVLISKAVSISGARADGDGAATIDAGTIPFYVDAPGASVTIQKLRFVRPANAGVLVYSVTGLVIASCRIEGITPRPNAPIVQFSGITLYGSDMAVIPTPTQPGHPQNISGRIVIADNNLDLTGGAATDNVLGITTFSVGLSPSNEVDMY